MLVSVIIPTADRSQKLATLMLQMVGQSLAEPFEIIVVDDRGNVEGCALRALENRCAVKLIRGEQKGPARARNLGAASAKGLYLVFLDDDSEVDAGYLERVLTELQARPSHVVAGRQRSINRTCGVALAGEWLLEHFTDSERIDAGKYGFAASTFAPSNGFGLRRDEFESVHGFDPRFVLAAGEDREFCARWVRGGGKIAILESLAIGHHFPERLRGFWKVQWRYGRASAQVRGVVDGLVRIRSAAFYLRLLGKPMARYGLRRGFLIALACAWAQVAVVAGFGFECCVRRGWSRKQSQTVCPNLSSQ